MANASEADEPGLPGPPAASTYAKLLLLGLIICVSLAGNLALALLVLKERGLHRAPYYFLLDLCLADAVRAGHLLPLRAGLHPPRLGLDPQPAELQGGGLPGRLFCFHAAFLLFCISVTRYMAVAHHRFYAKRLTPWTCVAVICRSGPSRWPWPSRPSSTWAPTSSSGGGPVHLRAPLRQGQRHAGLHAHAGRAGGATQAVYGKLLCFQYRHRRMKPVQMVPAVSQNWTFHGPGATGQAAANWVAGFGRGPMPPTLLASGRAATPPTAACWAWRSSRRKKRLGKMFYVITVLFLLLWSPYLVACYWRVFVKACSIPHRYLATAVWLSFAQAAVNPIVCFLLNKELTKGLAAHVPCRRTEPPLPREPYCVM
ncbi:unnamed protein product [Eretmochelys imbricata]